MSDRTAYLTSLIGQRWAPDRTCWHVAAEIQRELFGRDLPSIIVPSEPSWRWMIDTLAGHPERQNWSEVVSPHPGLVTARDGALVALGRADRAAHVGVWLQPERLVIHCDQSFGVVAQSTAGLRAAGWGRIHFYEPAPE